MRDDLLAYVLGELDADASARVEKAIQQDEELRREVGRLRACLNEQGTSDAEQDLPSRLAEQTCFLVDACQEGQLESSTVAAVSGAQQGSQGEARKVQEIATSPRSMRWLDAMAVVGISLALAALFFPAILSSRFRSHVDTCQDNLRKIGYAQTTYCDYNHGFFPEVPTTGKRAVAGIYAPLLAEHQLLPDPGILVCPGSSYASQRAIWRIPTLSELDACEGMALTICQRTMGGSYGYNLGYVKDGELRPVRNGGRFYYPVMSDAPTLYRVGMQSDNHAGRGQNVLYEDNHVQFICNSVDTNMIGAIFKNRLGFTEAGLDPADSVIARSSTPPLIVRE